MSNWGLQNWWLTWILCSVISKLADCQTMHSSDSERQNALISRLERDLQSKGEGCEEITRRGRVREKWGQYISYSICIYALKHVLLLLSHLINSVPQQPSSPGWRRRSGLCSASWPGGTMRYWGRRGNCTSSGYIWYFIKEKFCLLLSLSQSCPSLLNRRVIVSRGIFRNLKVKSYIKERETVRHFIWRFKDSYWAVTWYSYLPAECAAASHITRGQGWSPPRHHLGLRGRLASLGQPRSHQETRSLRSEHRTSSWHQDWRVWEGF